MEFTVTKPNGLILWQGASRIDGAPIVAILIGTENDSTNSKTGAMLQTYIVRADIAPTDAIATGADISICGDCTHRGDGTGKARTCYVNVGQGAQSVWKAFRRGVYPVATADQARNAGARRVVRLGTYGDPAAVPVSVWENLTADATAHTGYTHAWRGIGSGYSHLLMASADSVRDMREAHAGGWRTFRVVTHTNTVQRFRRKESVCPASAEAGYKLTCIDCKACDGNATNRRASVVIQAHGGTAVMANVRRKYQLVAA
jgi:hypothetical protein